MDVLHMYTVYTEYTSQKMLEGKTELHIVVVLYRKEVNFSQYEGHVGNSSSSGNGCCIDKQHALYSDIVCTSIGLAGG